MWDGPYGDWGSRKYLIASLDQSLKRMGLEYVDIFYHHRPDPETPLQETMRALDHLVRQGKALYVGLSNYPAELAREALDILNDLGTPCLIHQPKYSMFERGPEAELLDVLQEKGVGCIAFSPLAGGQLTAFRPIPAPPAVAVSLIPISSRKRSWRGCINSTRWRNSVVKSCRKWRWPGFYVTIKSPRY